MGLTTLRLLCASSTAFGAHHNAPKIYTEMKDGSPRNLAIVVWFSFGMAALLSSIFMNCGCMTLGSATSGSLLDSYSDKDPAAIVARIAIGISMIFTYPIVSSGLRGIVMFIFRLTHFVKVLPVLNSVAALKAPNATRTVAVAAHGGSPCALGTGPTHQFRVRCMVLTA